MEHLLGIRDGGQLVAVLCAGDHTPHGPSTFSIDFLAGEPAAVVRLVRHALNLAQDAKYVESMIPSWQGRTTVARDVFRELGFEAWNEWLEDVFVYELDLAGEKRVRTTP